MRETRDVHEPAPNRVLGALIGRAGRGAGGRLPGGALAVAGMVAAGGALAAYLAGANVLAGLLVLVAALLDTAGAASRTGGFGAAVDGVADRYADTLIIAGMAAWSRAHESQPAPLAVGFAALVGTVVLSYMMARVQASAGRATAAGLFKWAGRDVRLLVAAAGALTGQVYLALVALALLTHLPVIGALARLRRELRA